MKKKNILNIWKKVENKKALWILLGLIFLLIFVMCLYTFPTPDDLNYAHIPWTEIPLRSLGDVLRSQKSIYTLWSGRVIIMGIEQIFLMIHPIFFVLANSFLFVGLLYCMSRFTKKKDSVRKILFLFLCVWAFVPVFAENFIWISGSFNYLWACFFVLMAILLFYRKYILEKEVSYPFLIPVFLFLGAASHENAAFLLGSFLGVYVLSNFKKLWKLLKKKDILMILNVIAFCAGFAFLLLAPGNFLRAKGSSFAPSISIILDNLGHIKPLLLLVGLGLLFLLFRKEYKKCTHILLYFLLPAFISLTPMFFISEFPLRSLLPFCLFLILALFFCFSYFIHTYEKTTNLLLLVFLVLMLPSILEVSNYYLTVAKKYKEDVAFAVSYNQNAGYKEWTIDDMEIDTSVPSRFVLAREFRPGSFPNTIANVYFCRNYGCEQVLSKRKDHVLVEIELGKESDFDYDYYMMVDGVRINPLIPFHIDPGTEKENENILTFEIPKSAKDVQMILLPNRKLTIESIEVFGIGEKKLFSKEEVENLYEREEKVEKEKKEAGDILRTKEESGTLFLREEAFLS